MKFDSLIDIEECDLVYVPDDDTFLLLDCVDFTRGERVLEMGCGTGIISIHCARRGARVTAVDINPNAVECTRKNASANGVDVEVLHSDLFSDVGGEFDLILFNPPYLPVMEEGELERAWSGGEGGMEVVGRFLEGVPSHLTGNGRVLLLVSSKIDQAGLSDDLTGFRVSTVAIRSFFFEELRVLLLER